MTQTLFYSCIYTNSFVLFRESYAFISVNFRNYAKNIFFHTKMSLIGFRTSQLKSYVIIAQCSSREILMDRVSRDIQYYSKNLELKNSVQTWNLEQATVEQI